MKPRKKSRVSHFWLRFFRAPALVSFAQVLTDIIVLIAGVLTFTGSIIYLNRGDFGPVFGVVLGTLLILGGVVGIVTVMTGVWWLERVALLVTGLGWVMFLPATIAFALQPGGSAVRWLIFLMFVTAILDIVKRYRRIDWAYLDPQRTPSRDRVDA